MRENGTKIILQLYAFWQDFDFNETILPLKIIAITISVVLLLLILWLIVNMRKAAAENIAMIAESISPAGAPTKVIREEWAAVEAKLDKGDPDSAKLAVIDADKIFDDFLKKQGFLGEDMAARLRQMTKDQASNLDEIWQAHKLRNRLVHETGSQINSRDARRAVEIYQQALEELEAM